MGAHDRHSGELASVPALLVGFAVDYLRWTQLVPMLFAWAFLVLVVVLMLAVNFQYSIDQALERAEPWAERWLGPAPSAGESVNEGAGKDSEDGTLQLDTDDFRGWIYRFWLITALAGYLLGLVRAWLFGPWKPPPLKRKLVRVGVAAATASALLCFAWAFGSETYTGPAAGWLALFVIGPLMVWLISAWSLGISHLLDQLRPRLMALVDQARLALVRQHASR